MVSGVCGRWMVDKKALWRWRWGVQIERDESSATPSEALLPWRVVGEAGSSCIEPGPMGRGDNCAHD
jgi:hypothetical protein